MKKETKANYSHYVEDSIIHINSRVIQYFLVKKKEKFRTANSTQD